MSQNKVVAVKAVDAVDIRIDPMAMLLTCSAFRSATSWRTRLRARVGRVNRIEEDSARTGPHPGMASKKSSAPLV
jgi:hypothetical protein